MMREESVFSGDTCTAPSVRRAGCRGRGVNLILSGALADRLPADPRFTLRALGVWTPRGKSREVRLFTAERAA